VPADTSAARGARGRRAAQRDVTEWAAAMAQQLLARHGVVTRETVASEAVAGGFAAVYDVLKAMEDAGRIRRGYFVAGLGGAQFAMPAALDLVRSLRDVPEEPRTIALAATDPANPYGTIVKWPAPSSHPAADARQAPAATDGGRGPTRTAGSLAILVDGAAAAYVRRGEREILLFAPETEPQRSRVTREVARILMHLAAARDEAHRGMLIAEINGVPAATHPAARLFVEAGFAVTAMGLQARWHGTPIAGSRAGGTFMAERAQGPSQPRQEEGSNVERERVRSSNDRDQTLEREGIESEHNRGYDEAVEGSGPSGETNRGDIDPDSAESDVDRDDMIDEI
jgi:hypothetical protein